MGWIKNALFKKISKRQEEKKSENVAVDGIDNLADAHVKGSSGDYMETGIPKLQGQHGHVQLEPFGDRTTHYFNSSRG